MFFGVGEKLEREKEEATEKRLNFPLSSLPNSKTQKKLETSPHTTQETALTTSCSSFTRRATSA
jgi:hypothetical protein